MEKKEFKLGTRSSLHCGICNQAMMDFNPWDPLSHGVPQNSIIVKFKSLVLVRFFLKLLWVIMNVNPIEWIMIDYGLIGRITYMLE